MPPVAVVVPPVAVAVPTVALLPVAVVVPSVAVIVLPIAVVVPRRHAARHLLCSLAANWRNWTEPRQSGVTHDVYGASALG
jgi:hypothetical protein